MEGASQVWRLPAVTAWEQMMLMRWSTDRHPPQPDLSLLRSCPIEAQDGFEQLPLLERRVPLQHFLPSSANS
jgi:hypothetical protein